MMKILASPTYLILALSSSSVRAQSAGSGPHSRFGFFSRVAIAVLLIHILGLTMHLSAQQNIDLEKRLRQDHPRLLFTRESQEQIETLARKDRFLQELIESLLRQANQMLSQPTVRYEVIGPRLLSQSRDCLSKVMCLSMAYRLSGELKFAKRAVAEMRAAADFPDWNPGHFLDVAELCAALAIGYDWLFDTLSGDEKNLIKTALIEKGLKPGLQQYPNGFAKKINNWNFVCNGGLIMAALAIGDDEPELATEIISSAVASLPVALRSYAPDGAWFEGPSYWMYGSNYLAMLLSALQSALGTAFDFPDYPGLRNTGHFFLSSIGPSGNFFNYSDCRIRPRGATPVLFWLAQNYDQPFFAHAERQMLESYFEKLNTRDFGKDGDHYYYRFYALEIAWFDPRSWSEESAPRMDSFYRSLTDVVYFRSSWDDDALYAGFKGGNNAVNHAHLDCGGFIFNALGQRWAEDLGRDDYDLPGYFEYQPDGQRWNYFRISSLSHNVPTINGQNQRVEGSARIIAYFSSPEHASAVADLSDAYKGQAKSVHRGLSMLNRKQLLVQDEIVALRDHDELRWAMLTSADIALNGNQAVLKKGGETLLVELIQPERAVFTTASTRPTYHPNEKPNTGTRLLTISLPLSAGDTTRVAVILAPQQAGDARISTSFHKIVALDRWAGYLDTEREK